MPSIFLHIPQWLLCRSDIKKADQFVAALILSRQGANKEWGVCFQKQRNMAKDLGISLWSLNLSIARLTCTDGGRKTGRGTPRKNNYYRRPLVTKSRRLIGRTFMTVYFIDTTEGSTAWLMQEDAAGRLGLGDNRTSPKEWNFGAHTSKDFAETSNTIALPKINNAS